MQNSSAQDCMHLSHCFTCGFDNKCLCKETKITTKIYKVETFRHGTPKKKLFSHYTYTPLISDKISHVASEDIKNYLDREIHFGYTNFHIEEIDVQKSDRFEKPSKMPKPTVPLDSYSRGISGFED